MSYFCGVIMSRMTIEERIERSINTSAADVFLRRNFEKFGGYDQVGRALRAIIARGRLVKAGYGVYVRARRSSLTGNAVPAVPLVQIGFAVLSRLGIKAGLGSSALDYMEGKTTQMPMAAVINVGKSRISRKIGIGSRAIRYER